MIEMQGIKKVYKSGLIALEALSEFTLEVERGEFVAIMGPSGSGKTTFLNIAGLLDTYDEGSYLLDGEDVLRCCDRELAQLRNRKLGFVFQSFNLIPDLDVHDNLEVPLRYRGLSAKEREPRIERVLEEVGLTARRHHLPKELSGGQQQRVAKRTGLSTRWSATPSAMREVKVLARRATAAWRDSRSASPYESTMCGANASSRRRLSAVPRSASGALPQSTWNRLALRAIGSRVCESTAANASTQIASPSARSTTITVESTGVRRRLRIAPRR